jgi:hypothetical protein
VKKDAQVIGASCDEFEEIIDVGSAVPPFASWHTNLVSAYNVAPKTPRRRREIRSRGQQGSLFQKAWYLVARAAMIEA